MWPKVLAQLIELLPHVSRLLPMADKYLSSKSSAEKASETALAAMAEGVRGDLGQVTAAHAGLYRQLQAQSAQITEVGEEVRRARLSIEQHELKIEALDRKVASLALWIKTGISLLVVLLVIVLVLLLQLHGR